MEKENIDDLISRSLDEYNSLGIQVTDAWHASLMTRVHASRSKGIAASSSVLLIALSGLLISLNVLYGIRILSSSTHISDSHAEQMEMVSNELLINPIGAKN